MAGVDVARFLAVLGMFNIHFGVPFFGSPAAGYVAQFSSGRATALFTLLAGVSLAMLSGRTEPPRGTDLRRARVRIAVRAVLLIVLGLLLARATEATGFLITVIIPYYGVYFLLCVPFAGLRARGLAVAAGCGVLLSPQLSFVLRGLLADGGPLAGLQEAVESVDPAHLFADAGLLDLVLTGFYPAVAYVPLVLCGMAVGRLDLRSTRVRIRLGIAGLAAYAMARAGSATLLLLAGAEQPEPGWGGVDVDEPTALLGTTAHSGTTLELLSAAGTGLVILAACLELADRLGLLLRPVAAAGSMALTLYAAHALVLTWQVVSGGWPMKGVPRGAWEMAHMGPDLPDTPETPDFPVDPTEPDGIFGFVHTWMPEVFPIASLVLPVLWCLVFRRGPLEAALSEAVRVISARFEPLLRAPRTARSPVEVRQRS
ncbi:DUF1624 domain-containing protein [Saccharopolyspora sp. HNM0983]|uniref:DUF1624 domain-containing protein n=1 Tax=Saccharopolyspora montiporae TaxID=2781240 RepID=A0A929B9U3_9PSEU|nr:DUF1624 domain-containing protein [Saccharopolyspora sp. HNM0983]